jgi:hypothetical protein
MKRAWAAVLSAAFCVALMAPTSAAAGDRAPYCNQVWGSLAKESWPGAFAAERATVQNVRSGRHACYDRLVVDLTGSLDGYRVEYVREVRTDGAGTLVPLRGGARLRIIVLAPAYDDAYRPTYAPTDPAELRDVAGYRTFRQVADAGSFEGQTTLGLGVRARLPVRAFVLAGPGTGSRLVVDVAHRW